MEQLILGINFKIQFLKKNEGLTLEESGFQGPESLDLCDFWSEFCCRQDVFPGS